MEIDYKKAFKLFVGDDDLRPQFKTPFIQGDNYFATDATVLMSLPLSIAKLNYNEANQISMKPVMNIEEDRKIEINISEIESQLIPEMIPETIETSKECDDCDGDGEVDFEYHAFNGQYYQHNYTCPVCEGEGSLSNEILTGKEIANPFKKYQLFGVDFNYRVLKILVDVCKIMNVENIVNVSGKPKKQHVFKVGEATVILMPTNLDETEQVTVIKLNQLF